MPQGQNYQGSHYENTPWIFGAPVIFQRGFATSSAGSAAVTVTAPSVPTSGTGIATNNSGVNVAVYIACGAGVSVSVVKVNGTTIGTTVAASTGSGLIYLPATATISLTYAGGTPTWVWSAI